MRSVSSELYAAFDARNLSIVSPLKGGDVWKEFNSEFMV